MTTYEYPASGVYSETIATVDGHRMTVDCQYAVVLPHGKHADTCDQINKMGGVCNCGMLDGIDVAALVADARVNGKCGRPPVGEPVYRPRTIKADHQLCPLCGTYCYGDCEAR